MKSRLHIGHTGLLDAAPLLVAQAQGFFVREGLDVSLSCEPALAAICGKLADRRIDGACLPAPLPVLLSLGAGLPRVPMRVAAVCCWQGMGVVMARPRAPGGAPAVTRIGVVAPGTVARLLLHKLARLPGGPLAGEFTPLPMGADQLIDFLRAGVLDGFCGMDPLPALARLLAGSSCVADSTGLFPAHPGGVVALRAEGETDGPRAAALERALLRARDYCADPARREAIWRLLLAQPPYAALDAGMREALIGRVLAGEPGWTSMRFDLGTEAGGLSPAAGLFLENACRGAAGMASKNLDFKAGIARVYPRRETAEALPSLVQT